jgi:hypothetical protein
MNTPTNKTNKNNVFIGYYGHIRLNKLMTGVEYKIQQYYVDTYKNFTERITNERVAILPHSTNGDCSQQLTHKSHND